MKRQFLIFILLTSFTITFGQKPLCVVDGFFLKMDKTEAIDILGVEFINDTAFVKPDSAVTLIGEYGKYGLFVIKTTDPKSMRSMSLRTGDRLFFTDIPTIYINGSIRTNFDLNSVDPQKIDSINIISPLTSVKEEGMEFVGGKLKIWMKE